MKIQKIGLILFSIIIIYIYCLLTNHYYFENNYRVEIYVDIDQVVLTEDNKTIPINVILENRGRRIISSENNVNLSFHLKKDGQVIIFDNERYQIPFIGPFGTSETFQIEINNSYDPGKYTIQLDLVEEDIAWFSSKGNMTKDILLLVE